MCFIESLEPTNPANCDVICAVNRFESTSESETTYYTEEEEEEEEEEKEEERKKKKIHLNKYPAQQSNFLHVSRSRFAIIVGIGKHILY